MTDNYAGLIQQNLSELRQDIKDVGHSVNSAKSEIQSKLDPLTADVRALIAWKDSIIRSESKRTMTISGIVSTVVLIVGEFLIKLFNPGHH